MLSTRDPPQNRGYIQTESEGLEKDSQCFKCVTFTIYIWCKLFVLQSQGMQMKVYHKKHVL